jgi:hypothetical protein
MKKFLFLPVFCLIVSCSTQLKTHSHLLDDGVSLTRRYIGNFIDYSHTGPDYCANAHLIWIRTTQFSTFGKLSAYGKDCKFTPGERIYLRRMYSIPNANGEWEYQVENDSSTVYLVSKYKYDNNVLVHASF